jgi:hypothetical protein
MEQIVVLYRDRFHVKHHAAHVARQVQVSSSGEVTVETSKIEHK